MQLSGGPFTYNRFNDYEAILEGSKPDFLDMDKDGDKEEPMKKAIKEKGKKDCDCKEEPCDKNDDKKAKKEKAMKNIKEAFSVEEVSDARLAQIVLESGIANNEVSAQVIAESMSEEWAAHLLEQFEGWQSR